MVIVYLTDDEIELAGQAALRRAANAVKREAKNAYGAPDDGQGGVTEHYPGCLGEIAVAKHLNRYWNDPFGGIPGGPDVAFKYQVRAMQQDHHCLILHDKDKDKAIFFLARIALPRVQILGWLRAGDGKKATGGKTNPTGKPDRAAYFVRQHHLRAMEEFREEDDDDDVVVPFLDRREGAR